MISVGSIVEIGDDKYEVKRTSPGECSCLCCNVPICAYNDAMKQLRAQHNVLTCEKLIGSNSYFKKVE